MPRYDYRCECCGKEIMNHIARWDDEVACPCCGADMTRLPSAANFKLVGKGFHCNDYPKREGQ